MGDLVGVTLKVEGAEASQKPDGSLSAEVPADASKTITLKAATNPADVTVTWSWTKDETPLPSQDGPTNSFPFTDQTKGTYVVTAKAADGTTKNSNAVTLSPLGPVSPGASGDSAAGAAAGQAVVEAEIGEYDAKFAYVTLAVLVGLTVSVLFLLTKGMGLRLPGLAAEAPKSGTYGERLRAYAVFATASGGLVALGLGCWMAAIEARGRLRRKVSLSAPAATGSRGVAEEAAKILDAASRLRGTIAVIVAAVVLMLGALWAVGQAPDSANTTSTSNSSTSTSTSSTSTPTSTSTTVASTTTTMPRTVPPTS